MNGLSAYTDGSSRVACRVLCEPKGVKKKKKARACAEAIQPKGRNTQSAFLKPQTLQKQSVLPGAYEAELRAQPAWAECDIDEQCASAPCAEKLRIFQLLSAPKKC